MIAEALASAIMALGGDGAKRKGLLSRWVDGELHLSERWCPIGMWVVNGDSLRGGQPCSTRCSEARAAMMLCISALEEIMANPSIQA